MKVLRIQPKKYPEVIEIDGSLESLQKEVAGPIQAVGRSGCTYLQ